MLIKPGDHRHSDRLCLESFGRVLRLISQPYIYIYRGGYSYTNLYYSLKCMVHHPDEKLWLLRRTIARPSIYFIAIYYNGITCNIGDLPSII